MTRALRTGLRIALVAAPLLALATGRLWERREPTDVPAIERALDNDARSLQDEFHELLDEAAAIAGRAEGSGPTRPASGRLAARLEGTALLGPGGTPIAWSGTPVDPAAPLPATPGDRSWSVQVQGLWTRLVAVSPADGQGRRGLASFLLDGPASDLRFADLLRGLSDRSTLAAVDFIGGPDSARELMQAVGTTTSVSERAGAPVRFVPLGPAGGNPLAVATLRPAPAAQQVARARGAAAAVAALLFASLLPWVAPWPALCAQLPGLLATLAAIAAARGALLWARVPLHLFSRELGASTYYGSTWGLGLLGSPVDLLWTVLALAAATAAVLAFLRALGASRPRTGRLVALAGALAMTEAVRRISISVAVDARAPLLHAGNAARSPAEVVLLACLAIVLATAGAWWSFRRSGPWSARGSAIALVLLAALAAQSFLHASDHLAVDRLRSELAPQILEQGARRRVALLASVRETAASDRAADAVTGAPGGPSEYAAYLLWTSGDLFHSGYQSALDLYDSEGVLRSHFGFDLPALRESVPVPPVLETVPILPSVDIDPLVREESFREGSITRRLLHAEMPIFDDGRPVGTVVGHVLDEPDNLPFLPGSLPYLDALGFGAPDPAPDGADDAPGYVLYDAAGSVVLSTLAQPPAPGAAIRAAAAANRTLRLRAGDARYLALPLSDGPRLHLVLLPQPSALERIGVFLRLCLLGAAAAAGGALIRSWILRSRTPEPAGGTRGSFYRKLLIVLLVVSVLPVLGLSLFVRGYVDRRAQAALLESAARLATVVKRVVEDYASSDAADPVAAPVMNDEILHWLRRVVGQEIHLYQGGTLAASSKRELFSSGLLPPRLPGEADRRLVREGLPSVVLDTRLGDVSIPVAYTRVHLAGPPEREAIAAVPLVLERRELARAVARVREMLLLASVLLIALLAATASALARNVARPVRELAAATRRIAGGDYASRLLARTRDEFADLVDGFNAMAAALGAQRADLERRRDYIEALLRHATAGVVSTDPSGRIVTLNPAAARLLAGAGPPPAAGEDLAAAVARDRRLLPLAEALRRPARGDGEPEEVDLLEDGRLRRLRLVRIPLPDPGGGAPGELVLLDDVTDLMRANQLAAWGEMARAIAHEIKNPLTPIRLSAEHLRNLLRDRGVLPSPEIETCIDTVLKQVVSLRQIASEFSAYAKLPDLVFAPADPAELMREALSPYRAAPPAGVAIDERYDAVPEVSVDRRVLARAIVNLIENALHAMPAGGTLSVSVRADSARGEVVLAVGDTGPGLDPAVRSRLFEPYFSTKTTGTGLGLAIVRRAAEAHGGRVELESRAGAGAVFRLVLPAARGSAAGTPDPLPSAAGGPATDGRG